MYFAIQDHGLGIDKTTAMSIMSVYGALIYMSSIPGGWIADRITGTRGATLIGAVLIIIGHICLSLPFAMFGLFASMLYYCWFRFNEAKYFKYCRSFVSTK